MKLYYEEPDIKIYQGPVLETLRTLGDESINTIITSPPYWGLRDYGEDTKTTWDGDPSCEHKWRRSQAEHDALRYRGQNSIIGNNSNLEIHKGKEHSGGDFCSKCGAWYGQLGLEPTLDLYIRHLLQVTAELKRILRKDGIMFWNQGDCYGGSGCGKGDYRNNDKRSASNPMLYTDKPNPQLQLTPKCLALQNYRLILRMMDEQGWILRNSIIWNKPNHMPSSVKDRFSNAYEPTFMLVKNKKYWFDLDAVRVPHKDTQDYERHAPFNYRVREAKKGHNGIVGVKSRQEEMNQYDRKGQRRKIKTRDKEYLDHFRKKGSGGNFDYGGINDPKARKEIIKRMIIRGKNPGDVWRIPTQPFPEAHFATFPEKLVSPMILAGCPRLVCKKCGKARERITKTEYDILRKSRIQDQPKQKVRDDKFGFTKGAAAQAHHETIGWTDCGCKAGWEPGVLLDPFMGAGTAGVVAKKLSRGFVGIDIKKEYCKMAAKRIKNITPNLPFE